MLVIAVASCTCASSFSPFAYNDVHFHTSCLLSLPSPGAIRFFININSFIASFQDYFVHGHFTPNVLTYFHITINGRSLVISRNITRFVRTFFSR